MKGDVMKSMLVMLAKSMSQDHIIDKMEEAIIDYKEAKLFGGDVEKTLFAIKLHSQLLMLNDLPGDIDDVMQLMADQESGIKVFEKRQN